MKLTHKERAKRILLQELSGYSEDHPYQKDQKLLASHFHQVANEALEDIEGLIKGEAGRKPDDEWTEGYRCCANSILQAIRELKERRK